MPSVLAKSRSSADSEGGLLRTNIASASRGPGGPVIRYTRTLKPVGTVAAQE
jgi:hypothetical protein